MAKRSVKQGKVLLVMNKGVKPMENAYYGVVRLELSPDMRRALLKRKARRTDWTFTIPQNGEVCVLPTIHALGVQLQRAHKQPEDIIKPTWLRDMLD